MNTNIETLIAQLRGTSKHLRAAHPTLEGDAYVIDEAIAALQQADQQAQPAAQKTHSVEDSPEYKLGLAAGKASYARHYKCGCTAFPADAPAYCPIHGASQKEQQNGL